MQSVGTGVRESGDCDFSWNRSSFQVSIPRFQSSEW